MNIHHLQDQLLERHLNNCQKNLSKRSNLKILFIGKAFRNRVIMKSLKPNKLLKNQANNTQATVNITALQKGKKVDKFKWLNKR